MGMKQSIALLLIIFSFISLSAQTIVLEGEQIKVNKNSKKELSCTPVKISKTMKITEVEGNCVGFWIQKGSETVHKFTNLKDPVGTILQPGTYYVYPYIKADANKAHIKVTLNGYSKR